MRVSLNVQPIVQYTDWDVYYGFGRLVVRAAADTWFGDTEAVCAARYCGYTTTDAGHVLGLPYDFKDTVFWFVVSELNLRGCYPHDWERCKAADPQFLDNVMCAVGTGTARVGTLRRPVFRVSEFTSCYTAVCVQLPAYMRKRGLSHELLEPEE